MALPIARPYPVVANPATMRATAALPAAGAWDAAPTEVACAGYEWMRLYFTYTRGEQAEAGSVAYRYEISPYYTAHRVTLNRDRVSVLDTPEFPIVREGFILRIPCSLLENDPITVEYVDDAIVEPIVRIIDGFGGVEVM